MTKPQASTTRTGGQAEGQSGPRRLPRAQRREQILAAATRAFARSGFAATSLDDVAGEASVSRMIVYAHFDSKTELYRAVLQRIRGKLSAAAGAPDYTGDTVDGLLAVAAEEPDGFRLRFHHAAREPEFRAEVDNSRAQAIAEAHRRLAPMISDPVWARWAAALIPTVTIEAVMAWLDAGQPDAAAAAETIRRAIDGVIAAARAASEGN